MTDSPIVIDVRDFEQANAPEPEYPRYWIRRRWIRVGVDHPSTGLLGVAITRAVCPLELQLCLGRWWVFIEFGRVRE